MTSSIRRLSDCAHQPSADADHRRGIILPSQTSVHLAPQLVAVALLRAGLGATRIALKIAHPIIDSTTHGHRNPFVTDTEYVATRVLRSSRKLAVLLADYEAGIEYEISDDRHFPF